MGHCRAAILQDRREHSGREVAPPQRHKKLQIPGWTKRMNNREAANQRASSPSQRPDQHRANKPHALMQLAFPQIAISVTRIERGISNRNARRLGRRVDAFAFTIVPRIGTRHFFGFKKMQKKLMLGRLDIESSSTRVRQAGQHSIPLRIFDFYDRRNCLALSSRAGGRGAPPSAGIDPTQQMVARNVACADFDGEWNYTSSPSRKTLTC